MAGQYEFKQTEIGMIPNGWEVVKLGNKISLEYGKGLTESQRKNGKYPVFGSNGIVGYHNEFFVRGSGIAVGRKGTIGAINWSGGDFWPIDTTYFVKVTGNDVDLRWLYYKLTSLNLSKLNMATGTPGLNRDLVYTQLTLFPPLPEQKKIAEILSTVDQGIEKVDQVIEKTQKLKKGLMQELLTKGIGHKEFKDTEMGRIPKDWNVVRISDIADVKGGKRLPKGQKLVNYKTPYPYIRVLDFRNMGVDVSNVQFLLPETHKSIRQYIISSNDVYISIAGTVGIVGLIPPELDNANLTENAAKLCKLRNITKEFLVYFLNSNTGQNQISVYLGKAQQPKLALFRIEKIKVLLPPILEQQKIAEFLSAVDGRLELLRKRKERLKKIKKGLMNDLLTGKVRVTSLISEEGSHDKD
jgi:type I restriction enzyme S subunit